MSLKAQLLAANLGLTEAHFGTHESDLYVISVPGLQTWLKANYKFYNNIQYFIGAKGSDWAGKRCLDIPFANEEFWDKANKTVDGWAKRIVEEKMSIPGLTS